MSRFPRLALLFSHPYWIVVMAGFGAVTAAVYGRFARLAAVQVWECIFIAIATGLPAVLLAKRMMRADIESYADFSLGIVSGGRKERSWKAHRKSIMAAVPLVLAVGASAFLSWYFQLPYMAVLGMLVTLSLLVYPEQEEVYHAVKAKLEDEIQNTKH